MSRSAGILAIVLTFASVTRGLAQTPAEAFERVMAEADISGSSR